ncbi:class I histocompatibility antigen, F10 alpha chain-like [Chanos chanos]|uniref:Class I histocompatibility antigen, F10 alpha chain-like n=1 Tax=Chanos chanos TaxID=29144 RepID=A0A6J2UQK3_CHACN|nr:class I histocompatibility antigen, F10 alpha chain-like [Chanos chanos]
MTVRYRDRMTATAALIRLSISCAVSRVSHSLWSYATYILGDTAQPKFSLVLMLDDVQVGHYNSSEKRYIPQGHKSSSSGNEKAEEEDISRVFGVLYNSMKYGAVQFKHCLNVTDGMHVLQRLARCEMVNGTPGLTVTKNSLDGLVGDDITFDVNEEHFQVNERWPSDCYRTNIENDEWFIKTMYHPVCIKYLTKYLKEENPVMRRVKPTVSLFKKTLTDPGGILVTCLATGFYPRHINLTLLRDGQSVSEDQITGGILLPNGDDTYQMRKSLEISEEELREKHKYTCTTTHLSLDNKLEKHIGSVYQFYISILSVS